MNIADLIAFRALGNFSSFTFHSEYHLYNVLLTGEGRSLARIRWSKMLNANSLHWE